MTKECVFCQSMSGLLAGFFMVHVSTTFQTVHTVIKQ